MCCLSMFFLVSLGYSERKTQKKAINGLSTMRCIQNHRRYCNAKQDLSASHHDKLKGSGKEMAITPSYKHECISTAWHRVTVSHKPCKRQLQPANENIKTLSLKIWEKKLLDRAFLTTKSLLIVPYKKEIYFNDDLFGALNHPYRLISLARTSFPCVKRLIHHR